MSIKIILKLTAIIGGLALALVGVVYGIAPLLPGAGQLGYSSESHFYVLDVARSIEHRLLEDPAQPQWSPDGDQMAYIQHAAQGTSDSVLVAGMFEPGPKVIYPAQAGQGVVAHSPAWSPFDTQLAFTYLNTESEALELVVVEPGAGTAQHEQIAGDIPAGSILNWTAADCLRYVSAGAGSVRLNELCLNKTEPVIVREWPFNTMSVRQAVLSGNGTRFILPAIVPHNLNFELYLFDTESDDVLNLSNRSLYNDTNPVWSPDEQHILFRSLTDSGQYLMMMNADGSDQRNLFHIQDGLFSQANWSPDGRNISYVRSYSGNNKRLCIFQVANSTVNCPAQDVDQASWRPNR